MVLGGLMNCLGDWYPSGSDLAIIRPKIILDSFSSAYAALISKKGVVIVSSGGMWSTLVISEAWMIDANINHPW